jgi:hypothetical protein
VRETETEREGAAQKDMGTYLMEARLPGERDTKLSNASMKAIITAKELRVTFQALILHCRQCLSQRIADGKSSPTVCHAMTEMVVLLVAFRGTPNVPHLPRIILAENTHQVLGREDSIIVAHDKPPHIGKV